MVSLGTWEVGEVVGGFDVLCKVGLGMVVVGFIGAYLLKWGPPRWEELGLP